MMKRFFFIIIIAVLPLALFMGCSKKKDSSDKTTTAESKTQVTQTGKVDTDSESDDQSGSLDRTGLAVIPSNGNMCAISTVGVLREVNNDFNSNERRPKTPSSGITCIEFNNAISKLIALTSEGMLYSRVNDATSKWDLNITLENNNWISMSIVPSSGDMYAISANGDLRSIKSDFSADKDQPDISDTGIIDIEFNNKTSKLVALTSQGKIYSRNNDDKSKWTLSATLDSGNWVSMAEIPTDGDIYAITIDGKLSKIDPHFSISKVQSVIYGAKVVDMEYNKAISKLIALSLWGKVYTRSADSTSIWRLKVTMP